MKKTSQLMHNKHTLNVKDCGDPIQVHDILFLNQVVTKVGRLYIHQTYNQHI
jgi:hypothetical protein